MELIRCRRTLMPLGQFFFFDFRSFLTHLSVMKIALILSKCRLSLRMSIPNFWRWLNSRLFVSCQLTQSRPSTSRGMLVPLICSLQFDLPTQMLMHILHLHIHFVIVIVIVIVIVLQDISGEHLNRGSNKAQDARLHIHAHGFWERHG